MYMNYYNIDMEIVAKRQLLISACTTTEREKISAEMYALQMKSPPPPTPHPPIFHSKYTLCEFQSTMIITACSLKVLAGSVFQGREHRTT